LKTCSKPVCCSPMRPRLLFTFLYPSTFVRDDLDLLGGHYDIRTFPFVTDPPGGRLLRPYRLLSLFVRQFFWLLRELPAASLVYGWFADYHMVLPVMMSRWRRRPSVVVLGGFDSNHLPELAFGVFHSPWRGPLARLVARNATQLLAVTPGLIYSEDRFATWPEPRKNGILAHVPGLKTPCQVLSTGFDPHAWPLGPMDRSPSVCTSAWVNSERTFLIKGLDLYFEVARRVPDAIFSVLGIHDGFKPEILRRHQPPGNVRLVPPRPRETLPRAYAAESVYLQLSRTEGGLPMALGEAMLCGCIPVASRVGGMPDTVGDAGYLVDAPDPMQIASTVREALAVGSDPIRGPEARRKARARIEGRFHHKERADRLLAIFQRLHAPSAP
jgi:glycosyltransferase involved in cell wall biosynthesis